MTSDASRAPRTGDLPRTMYVDTQFLFAYMVPTDEDYEAAGDFVRDLRVLVESGLAVCSVSVLVLDELAWALGGPLYVGEQGAEAWRRVGRREAFLCVREQVAAALADLLGESWIDVVPADAASAQAYPDTLASYPLSPADSAHLTIAIANGIEGIVTNDRHFAELADCPIEVVRYSADQAAAPS